MEKLLRDITLYSMAFINLLLFMRLVLRLLAANQETPFVALVYVLSIPFLAPFAKAFPTPSIAGGYTLEFSTIFAMFVYSFVGYVIIEIIDAVVRNRKNQNVI